MRADNIHMNYNSHVEAILGYLIVVVAIHFSQKFFYHDKLESKQNFENVTSSKMDYYKKYRMDMSKFRYTSMIVMKWLFVFGIALELYRYLNS